MWYLESPRGEVYKVTPGRVHTVSRKNGDIVLANDQSVSRKHAFLEVRTPMTEGIAVWDESSKYGTFVDDEITRDKRLTAGSKRIVKEGAKIRFGLQEINIWTLKVEKLCVCAHMLRPIEKSKVKSVLNVMGHELVDNWVKEATHLTTNYLSLSYEVLCALASAKPIVLPEFWQHYAHMVSGEGALPDPAKFMPPLEDSSTLGSRKACLPNVQRKTLFVDKTFIFSSSRSFNALKTVIATAGGKALKMSDCGLSLADYCKPNVVVLDCEEDHQTSFYNRVLSTLLDNNLRIIPVQDIGLALWKVSTSTHCNPKHTPNSVLRRPTDSERDEGATIVMNTEDIDASLTGVDIHDDQVIPPSLTETHATDDATMSMSVRATEKTSPAGPSRKRFRENSVERQNSNSVKVSRGKNSVKKEPEEEEDMFAFEDYPSRPSTSNNSSSAHFTSTSNNSSSKRLKNGLNSFVVKEDKHADDDDGGFTFNPPPKKKKIKQQEEEEDLFELPKAPSPNANRNDEDEFDFLSSSKLSKSMRDAKLNLHEESRDMFQTEDLPSTSSSSTRGEKRKGTGDTESESPPFKKPSKPCLDVTNVHNSQKHSKSITGFLTKRDNSFIKTEIKTDADEETDLSDQLCAKVVIRSLLRKPQGNGHNNTSVNSTEKSGKNFKKFKKVWSGSATKHHITTSRVRTFGGHTLNSTGMEEEDQDDDDPFIPSRPAARRQNGKRNNINDQDDDDDDEFALPAMSQCM